MATSTSQKDEWVKRITKALQEFKKINFPHENLEYDDNQQRSSIWQDDVLPDGELSRIASDMRRSSLMVSEASDAHTDSEPVQVDSGNKAQKVDVKSGNCLTECCRGGSGNVRVGGLERPVSRSFAPERPKNKVKWYSDGQGYYRDAAEAIKSAQKEILITDWFFSPELMLTRKVGEEPADQLMELLKDKAHNKGVAVRVLIYAEVESALANDAARVVKELSRGNHVEGDKDYDNPKVLANVEVIATIYCNCL